LKNRELQIIPLKPFAQEQKMGGGVPPIAVPDVIHRKTAKPGRFRGNRLRDARLRKKQRRPDHVKSVQEELDPS
jgi:hypothetical protein